MPRPDKPRDSAWPREDQEAESASPLLCNVLERNIATLAARRASEEAAMPWQERLAAAITAFTGSMTFVVIHVVVFGLWILVNAGLLPLVPKWDESFIILGTSASIEAIFLSTFILISQNRMAVQDNKRADMDLQVSLLAEHEVTKIATLVAAIAERLGVETDVKRAELEEIQRDVAPEAVLDQLDDPKR